MMYLATCRYRLVASEKFLGCHVDVSYVCFSQALLCDFAVCAVDPWEKPSFSAYTIQI
jgi:hypothetical protein